jgi:putative serine protease PepD
MDTHELHNTHTPYYSGDVPGPPPGPAHTRDGWSSGRKTSLVAAALAVALGSGAIGAAGAIAFDDSKTRTVYTSPVVQGSTNGGVDIPAIAKALQPSVVSIKVVTQAGGDEGSGIVLRADGTIVTNNHVVEAAENGGGKITVEFNDGKSATATIVGTDSTTDLAVIKAAGVSNLKPATLGDSDKLQVGDPVVAIGSPLGLSGSVTNGIVSALHRSLSEGDSGQDQQQAPGLGGQPQAQAQSASPTIGDAIQTDASINPGNSGGPLVNGAGQVIGINTAIATSGSSSGNIGVGFAIPVSTVKQVTDQLITSGKATHAYLGVGLTDATGDQEGALLSNVQSGSPADKAGLKAGDLITKADQQTVDSATSLAAAIRTHQPGEKIVITYLRNGQSATVTVTLTTAPAN